MSIETPIVAIIEEWRGTNIHWHVFENMQDAQKMVQEIEAAGNKAQLNTIYGNWTWHSKNE